MEYKKNLSFLYIVDLNPPSGIRAFEISKRLINKNINLNILTKRTDENRAFEKSIIKKLSLSSFTQIYSPRCFELKNKFLIHLLNYFFRFDFYIDWLPFAYLKAKKILKKNKNCKFIYASGPHFYNYIVGYLLKKKFNIPLILEYRDPWSFSPYNEKKERWLNKKIDLILEKKIIKSADIIITVSPALISFLKEKFKFIKNKQIYSIANGLNLNNSYNIYQNDENGVIFTFAGRLYGKRTVIPLLKIISTLKKQNYFNNIKFCFKIYGYYDEKRLSKVLNKLDIRDLVYLGGFVPRNKVIEEILNSNLAIHIGEALNYPTISFKVWEYLSCKKKIIYLGLEDSYTAHFLTKYDLGNVIPLDNLDKGMKTFKNLINDIIEEKFNYQFDEKILLEFSWDKKAESFLRNVLNKKDLP